MYKEHWDGEGPDEPFECLCAAAGEVGEDGVVVEGCRGRVKVWVERELREHESADEEDEDVEGGGGRDVAVDFYTRDAESSSRRLVHFYDSGPGVGEGGHGWYEWDRVRFAGGDENRHAMKSNVFELSVLGCAGGELEVVLCVEGEGFGVVVVHVGYYALFYRCFFGGVCHCYG